jgi:putative endonuclease
VSAPAPPRLRGGGRSREARERAYRRGRWSEALCRALLRLKLYRILARSYRVPVGEIDIVARRGRTLVFVEVKARDSFLTAAEAIGPRQRQRIARAASLFMAQHPALAGCALRFDVMLVRPWRLPRHLAGAWRSEDAAPGRHP